MITIKIAWRNINKLRYADDTTLMAESIKEPKSLLMKVKENEKVGLKLNNQKTKIMVSGPITSWQIDGETVCSVCKTLLSFALLHSVLQGQICLLLQVFLDFLLLHSSPL